jgi:FtsP/CotA-like multicopper oxidase with cupredoxin domain
VIVDEAEPPDIDHDVALVLDAWRPPTDGAPASAASDHAFTVNGAPSINLPVRTNERLRLRLLNATPEILAVRIERHAALVMALDGQPAEPVAARGGRLRLAPGNRADLFVDALLTPGATAPIALETERGDVPVARLVYRSEPPARPAPRPAPPPLPANPLPEQMDFTHALHLTVPLDALGSTPRAAPLFTAKRGRAVMLALRNTSAAIQVAHVHGHAFRLLDNLDDGWKPFWLDTLAIEPGQTQRIAFAAEYAGRFLLESAATDWASPRLARWYSVGQ